MSTTPNLSLKLIHPHQAQKELTANDSFAIIDGLLNNSIRGINVNSIPIHLAHGDLYHLGASPEGEWAGHAGNMALYTSGGWRFFFPRHGLVMWSLDHDALMVYKEGSWAVI